MEMIFLRCLRGSDTVVHYAKLISFTIFAKEMSFAKTERGAFLHKKSQLQKIKTLGEESPRPLLFFQ